MAFPCIIHAAVFVPSDIMMFQIKSKIYYSALSRHLLCFGRCLYAEKQILMANHAGR